MSPPLRLTFVTKSDPGSGNFSTALRICDGLVAAQPSWSYKVVSVTDIHPETESRDETVTGATDDDVTTAEESLFSADVLLCLHLYRCGAPLMRLLASASSSSSSSRSRAGLLPPVIGIAGGTDLNVDATQSERRVVMQQFVSMCRHIVVFSESMLQSLIEMLGGDCGKTPVSVVPQGISSGPLLLAEAAAAAAADASAASDEQLQLPDGCQRYFISVGRIRPVKHCSSLLGPFTRWRTGGRHNDAADGAADAEKEAGLVGINWREGVRLVFLGDIEDSNYGDQFKAQVERSPGVHLLRGVQHWQALRLMLGSLGLINSSLSEGQSNSVLEAMTLGVPVIVSAIPGNLDLVSHMETGLVYRDDEQLIRCLETAASQDPHCQQAVQSITSAAVAFVQQRHSVDTELQAYISLISSCRE